MIDKSKVYIKVDSAGCILACEGGYTMRNIPDVTQWTLLDEGFGDKFNLCQTHYFEGGLYTDTGIPRYKFVDGKAVLRSEEELAADRAAQAAPEPSWQDAIEAQIMYTALLTDTLIEEGGNNV